MPRRSLEVPVDSKVLAWARKSIGLSPVDVSKRLGVSTDLVGRWESGHKYPTLKTLEKLANLYKRSLAVFFLSKPPKELPFPKDFRSLPKEERQPLSPKARLAIRNARRMQSLTIELIKGTRRTITSKIKKVKVSDDPEVLSRKIRQELGVEIEAQVKWRNNNQAFNEWRTAVERLGIFVFQMSIPLEEMRAFSLTDKQPQVIVLNKKDSITARIFSLFHELAHLLLGSGGICNMEEYRGSFSSEGAVEKFCNHFAGALLVPSQCVLIYKDIRSFSYPDIRFDEILKRSAGKFKISQEVMLRRLLICRIIKKDAYERKREEWKAKGWKPPKSGFSPDPARRCIRERGIPFIDLTIEAYRQGQITYSDVADYLSVRTKYLPKIEKLIQSNF